MPFWIRQKYIDNYCFIHINKCGGTSVERFLGVPQVHDTAHRRIERIGRRRWDKNYTFALIRHPYARAVSHYRYRVKINHHTMQDGCPSLNDWIQSAYGDQDRRFYNHPLMFAPCVQWLAVDGRIVVDDVVKLEEIDDRWSDVCEKIGVPFRPLIAKNATSGTSMEEALSLLNNRSIENLNNHFSIDFERFDYLRVD